MAGRIWLAGLLWCLAAGTAHGQLIISELRLRGPNGPNDEFIEIHNPAATDHLVVATSGNGYGIAASNGATRCMIPNGTVIPALGHWLCTNNVAYSLGGYAGPDGTHASDIPDNAGVALFNNDSGGAEYSLANRLDAVGTTIEANTLYKEGSGVPPLTPFAIDYAFRRDDCGKGGAIHVGGPCPSGARKDTGNNAVDFYFVDTNGTSAGAGTRMGAPGPQNSGSPRTAGTTLASANLDPCVPAFSFPNTFRDPTQDSGNNATFGTIEYRHTFTNNTGQPITRLKFRIVDLPTFPAPTGVADFRARTSPNVQVMVDRPPCGDGTTEVTAIGTTLEQPPAQPNGGNFGSSMSVPTVTQGVPLDVGASIDLRFLFGVQQEGQFRIGLLPETIPFSPGDLIVRDITFVPNSIFADSFE